MNKISLDDIVNANDLYLIHDLECPIDSMISFNPVMCKKCETIFCQDCIESWKVKSNVCPMRCNPMETTTIDRTILKLQINKIRLSCTFHRNGCLYQVPPQEVSRHEKICEYRPTKCEKCQEMIPTNSMISHLYESCEKTKVSCFICESELNLKDMLCHLEECRTNSVLCKNCTANISKEGESHNMSCPLMIVKCPQCAFPDLLYEIDGNRHKCITGNQLKENNFNSYLKSVHSKYESLINNLTMKHEERFRLFNKSLTELTGDILKRENDKNVVYETKFNKLYDDYSKKMKITTRDKYEQLNKVKLELVTINSLMESKEQEIGNLDILFAKNKNLLIKEYEFRIHSKKQNLGYLRNLLIHSQSTGMNSAITGNDRNLSIGISAQRTINCKYCKKDLSDSNTNRCGHCTSPLCKSCSIQCQNKMYEHPNNICQDCLVQCSLCLGKSQCKICTKKCFYKNCGNLLCNKCYDRNKHQLRPENTNCKFYKCDSCQTDANCIMATVYCARCDRRVCKKCFHQDHQLHIVIK